MIKRYGASVSPSSSPSTISKYSVSPSGERTLKKKFKKIRRHPAKTITDADYADDIAIQAKIHPTKPKHYCIVWNESLQALVSMSMHTKRNICAIIKQATSPH